MACWWLSSSYVFPSFCEQISAVKDTSHWVGTHIMTLLQLITPVKTPLFSVSHAEALWWGFQLPRKGAGPALGLG